ncbi:VOC family protein [Roseibium sp. SCP14]|uniref:VOC family protein n=1 Tax=Roseibium sp. SCP14 TaxID=3141375 RepID=UPI003335BB8A
MATHETPRSQTLLTVGDVLRSSNWYADLLQLQPLGNSAEETHGNTYNRLYHGDTLVLQLHAWDVENHPNMVGRDRGPAGHGVLIWFEIFDFEEAIERARILTADIIQGPLENPNSGQRELWLHDPDGYTVVISAPHE